MGQDRSSARLFAILLAVALPPLVAFAITVGIAPDIVGSVGLGTFLLTVVLLTTGWAGIVTLVASRWIGVSARSMLELAERGRVEDERDQGALAQVADALDERNLQIAELASRARLGSSEEGPAAAADHIVATARLVTRDPTWNLAVLFSDEDDLLPAGVYAGGSPPDRLEQIHQWASSVETDSSGDRARRAEGPWGAFLIVDVLAAPPVRAILLAPHEGRATPARAELNLLAVLGELGAASLEHALLIQRVRRQAEALDRLGALQRDFLRGVSHDLQAPLTSIGALAAEVRASANDPRVADDLDLIAYQADRLRRMVAQLLTMSRLEAGALQPRQEVFRADAVLERAWRALRAQRPFEIVAAGTPHLVVGDPDRLEQVAWAVLDNAVKYSPPTGKITIEVRGEPGPTGLTSQISIADEGAGFSADELERAFEPFFRADAGRRLSPDGSGIGLYTARGLMEAMGGGIRIAGSPGHGTTVTLELPAEPAALSASEQGAA